MNVQVLSLVVEQRRILGNHYIAKKVLKCFYLILSTKPATQKETLVFQLENREKATVTYFFKNQNI